jgi:MATE family multidrug resistance protein
MALAVGLAVVILEGALLAASLAVIGGSDAVQAATADYWRVRVLATPFALANYVVLGWLIGVGRAGYGLFLQTVLNGVNIVLSILLVNELRLGVTGVGWASFAAETATALLGVAIVWRLMGETARPERARILDGGAFLRMIAVNRDIMIRSFTLLFAFGFFTAQSASAGDVVLAANEILLNLTMVGAFFLDGLAAAAEQLAGRAIGARYRPAFERALTLVIGWGFAVGAAVSLFFLAAGTLLIDLMTTSAAVRAAGRAFLPFAALVPVAGTLAYQMDGVFIGATWSVDMRNMMLISLAVYLLTFAVLTPVLGIAGLWIALLVFVGARGASLYWRARRRVATAFPA